MALQFDITPAYYLANQRALDAWVEAHGVDKTLVPPSSTIRISQDRVRFEQHVRDPDGGLQMDPATGEPRRITVTARLVQPWPIT